MPLAGMVPLLNIQLGEVIFGGVGAGSTASSIFAILAVFIAGLMVGRTPEYLGKKIEAFEMKMAMLAVLVLGASILAFTALASVAAQGLAGLNNAGPHGFSEMLYAFSSATGNNGSAFAGLTANTPFYNTTLGLRDADRALPDDRADPGHRRVDGAEAGGPAEPRHLPDHRPALGRPAGRRRS